MVAIMMVDTLRKELDIIDKWMIASSMRNRSPVMSCPLGRIMKAANVMEFSLGEMEGLIIRCWYRWDHEVLNPSHVRVLDH